MQRRLPRSTARTAADPRDDHWTDYDDDFQSYWDGLTTEEQSVELELMLHMDCALDRRCSSIPEEGDEHLPPTYHKKTWQQRSGWHQKTKKNAAAPQR